MRLTSRIPQRSVLAAAGLSLAVAAAPGMLAAGPMVKLLAARLREERS